MATLSTEKWLESVRFADPRILAYEQLILLMRDKLDGVGASGVSDMPGGGKKGDFTDTYARITQYESEVEALKRLRNEVETAIMGLEYAAHRTALELYYLRNIKSWAEVGAVMGYDERTARRWRDRAIEILDTRRRGTK